MATLPLAFECNFEENSTTPFDSETDTDGKGNVRHYSYLAKQNPSRIPYLGAYAYEIDLAGGTNDCYLQEDSAFDTSAAGTVALRFYLWVSGLTMAASDYFTLATLQSAGPTDEAVLGIVRTAGGVYQFVAGETSVLAAAQGAATRSADLIQNQYHCLELACTVDAGVGNDGTIAFFLDGQQVGAAITALDQGALAQMRLGAIGIDAGTTRGILLFDCIAGDTVRVGTFAHRWGQTRILTKTGHAVLGPASIVEADLIQSGAAPDETMTMWDTDEGDTSDLSKRVVVFQAYRSIYVQRGLYCVIAGTNPVGVIKTANSLDQSEGGIKNLAFRRSF